MWSWNRVRIHWNKKVKPDIKTKIDISKINKINAPEITVINPAQVEQAELTPKFKNVVKKAVKTVNSSLTENDYNYYVEAAGEDWPINITNDKTVEVQIQGKNNATGQTKPIPVIIKNKIKKRK